MKEPPEQRNPHIRQHAPRLIPIMVKCLADITPQKRPHPHVAWSGPVIIRYPAASNVGFDRRRQCISFLLSAALIAICSAATAQPATCSRSKAECDKGAAGQGEKAVSQCQAAFRHCLKTGVWHIPGTDGRTMMDVSRK